MVLRKTLLYRVTIRRLLAVCTAIFLQVGGGVVAAGNSQTLLISVAQTRLPAEAHALPGERPDAADLHATIQRPPRRSWNTRFREQPGSFLQVRVLEGRTAFISIGRREPAVQLLWVEEAGYGPVPNVGFSSRESGTGFYVKAELNEGGVILQLERYSNQSGNEHAYSNTTQALRTMVTGQLGEWLDIGGSMKLSGHRPGTRMYSVDHPHDGQFRVLVRVEVVP